MLNFSRWSIAWSVAVLSMSLSAPSFGWSISGTVKNTSGQPLGGVKITSFNYAGVVAETNNAGLFSIDENSAAILGVENVGLKVHYGNSILSIENVHAKVLKVSAIDALGKVIYQRSLQQVFGVVSFDLSKTSSHGVKFVRINVDGANSSYLLSGKGALLKDGAPLPGFNFAKDGYANKVYQMTQENESGVEIIMVPGSNNNTNSSSSAWSFNNSSNSSQGTFTPPEIPTTCAGKTATVGNHNMSVVVDGKTRTFIMHVPNTYDGTKPVPLVVDYHPVMGSGQGQYDGTSYRAETDPEGVISLYPDGTKSADQNKMGPGWNVGPCCSDDDDIKFSREMIKKVQQEACINPRRIYATGFSMGGGMSNHVACNMSDIYAAVAPAGMDLNTQNSADCNPVRPISVIMFRGTNDGTCSYKGGDSGHNDGLIFLGAEGNFTFWKEKNGCTGNWSTNSSGCREYSNCNGGTKVVLCVDKGIPSGWSGPDGHAQGDGKIGWPFLKQFELK